MKPIDNSLTLGHTLTMYIRVCSVKLYTKIEYCFIYIPLDSYYFCVVTKDESISIYLFCASLKVHISSEKPLKTKINKALISENKLGI